MKVEDIARVGYEAVRAYHNSLNKYDMAPWKWALESDKTTHISNATNIINTLGLNTPVATVGLAEDVTPDVKIAHHLFSSIVVALAPHLESI